MPVISSESRRRRKDRERDDRDPQPKDRSKNSASRSSRKSSTSSPIDRNKDRDRDRDRRPGSSNSANRRGSAVVPEMDRRPSAASGDVKVAYPSFSRAHSKEFVRSKENVVNPRLSLYPPDATILDSEQKAMRGESTSAGATFGGRPPSP